ncbi:MAG TPA: DUF3047 domain-containing protein [Paracoccaceae bacterium]|nr:DUF3047 domain-containing protein [Paracoccaceae bacterium]HMO71503.1 DUF3047 domain-containing protein [Paracoccaceae bacterium]
MPRRAAPRFSLALALALAAALPAPARALGPVDLSGWTEQRFSLLAPARFRQSPGRVTVRAESSVSLIWRALPQPYWPARQARWIWEVAQGVPATDLTQRGGDDRNLALYFVFMPEDRARAFGARPNLRRLLGEDQARVLVYVWGGDAARGTVLPSAYLGPRGRTVVLRGPAPGRHGERVDLAADHARAFGTAPAALVGLAISADSDDTRGVIEAGLSALMLD